MAKNLEKLIRIKLTMLYSKTHEAKAFVDVFAVQNHDGSDYHLIGPRKQVAKVSNWGLSQVMGGTKIGKDRMEKGIELEVWSKEADFAVNLERIKLRANRILNEQIDIRKDMLQTLDLLKSDDELPESPEKTTEEVE